MTFLVPGVPGDQRQEGRKSDRDRTAAECIAMLAQTYKPEGVAHIFRVRIDALGGEKPGDLMETSEGRQRVYGWALSLAEGSFS